MANPLPEAYTRGVLGHADATRAVLRPIRTGNSFEETVERILMAIKLGLVDEGAQLPPEREFARRLGVSRVTLSEALRSLQHAGVVESRRGRYGGTFVVHQPISTSTLSSHRVTPEQSEELLDALALREVLEIGIAALAAERSHTHSAADHLRRRHSATDSASPETYRRMDSRLHLAVAELTGSHSLVVAIADVRMRLNALLDAIPLITHNIEHANEQHRLIVEAILGHDVEAARDAMSQHVAGTAALLRGFLA